MADPRGLERQVWFYRMVALVLLVLLGMLALKLKRIGVPVGEFGNEGEVWAVDLDERVPSLEQTRGERADYSESYLYSSVGSVHLHAMGHQQTTPLHLHPASDEFTVIVSGTAHVTQAWGEDGGIVSRTADFPPGSGLASGSLLVMFLTLASALFVMGLCYGPLGAWLPGLYAVPVRYTGISLAFNLGGIVGGALAPFGAAWLAENGGVAWTGLVLSAAGMVTLAGVLLAPIRQEDAAA